MATSEWQWDPPLDDLLEPIRRLPGPTIIIGISGYCGSGKTTLAQAMAQPLSAPVVSLDEFGTPGVFGRSEDWNGFDRNRLVSQVLAPVTQGVRDLSYDRCDNWDSWETVSAHLAADRFVIVEGVGLFHWDVVPYLDYRIWLDVPLPDASARGIARERHLGRDPGTVWSRVWEPNEIDFERRFHPRKSAHRLIVPRRPVP